MKTAKLVEVRFKRRVQARMWVEAAQMWLRVDRMSAGLEARMVRTKEPRLRAVAKVLHEQAERYRAGVREGMRYVERRQEEFVVED